MSDWLPTAFTLGFPLGCYAGVRSLPSTWIRGGITLAGCVGYVALATRNSPRSMAGVMQVSLAWMCSIRLINLMTLPDEERLTMSFPTFLGKFLWFAFPVQKRQEPPRPPLALARHVGYHFGLAAAKVVFCSWTRELAIKSLEAYGGGPVVMSNYFRSLPFTTLYCAMIASSSADNDIQIALCSLLTLDRYEIMAFNDFPVLSSSLREFWGTRYNKLVSALLRESVFQPLRKAGCSPAAAALASFALSGALHVHVAIVGFGGGALPAFSFFALHALGCWLETRKYPRIAGMLITQAFVLATAPLYIGLFVRASPEWLYAHPPQLLGRPVHLPFVLPLPHFTSVVQNS